MVKLHNKLEHRESQLIIRNCFGCFFAYVSKKVLKHTKHWWNQYNLAFKKGYILFCDLWHQSYSSYNLSFFYKVCWFLKKSVYSSKTTGPLYVNVHSYIWSCVYSVHAFQLKWKNQSPFEKYSLLSRPKNSL